MHPGGPRGTPETEHGRDPQRNRSPSRGCSHAAERGEAPHGAQGPQHWRGLARPQKPAGPGAGRASRKETARKDPLPSLLYPSITKPWRREPAPLRYEGEGPSRKSPPARRVRQHLTGLSTSISRCPGKRGGAGGAPAVRLRAGAAPYLAGVSCFAPARCGRWCGVVGRAGARSWFLRAGGRTGAKCGVGRRCRKGAGQSRASGAPNAGHPWEPRTRFCCSWACRAMLCPLGQHRPAALWLGSCPRPGAIHLAASVPVPGRRAPASTQSAPHHEWRGRPRPSLPAQPREPQL